MEHVKLAWFRESKDSDSFSAEAFCPSCGKHLNIAILESICPKCGEHIEYPHDIKDRFEHKPATARPDLRIRNNIKSNITIPRDADGKMVVPAVKPLNGSAYVE